MEEQKNIAPVAPKSWYDVVPSWRRFIYVLLIACAPALLVWAFFDSATRSQDKEIANLRLVIQKLADQQNEPFVTPMPEGEKKMAPPRPEGWKSFEGIGYQLDLPPGYKLSIGPSGYDNIYYEPAMDDQPLPLATIATLPADQEDEYAGLGGRIVISGDKMYRIYLYENLGWKEFDQVASSLRLR
jgi:hypothetical protein